MNSKGFWSAMAPHINGFIGLKRSLGYKYKEQETCLHNFDRFVLDQGYTGVGLTKDIADKWAENRHNATKLTMYSKINIVKQFAEYLQNQGISTYIPRLPKYPHSAFIPYIYSHQQIDEMFKACDSLKIKQRNLDSCILIIPCLIRLLYGTGIRINEALSLQNKDVDTDVKCLTIRDSKNGKDRLVPISNSLTLVCLDYINQRKKIPMEGLELGGAPFFVSLNGRSCKYNAVYNWFRKIITIANIPFTGNRKGPRIHDIRHSAACHSFIKLSDEGLDLYCSWPYLSTYLGHQSLEATEQYIRMTSQMFPELLKHTDNYSVDILPDLTSQPKNQL